MPYPTPPVLVPFEPEQTPNLMAGGTYSDQLNKIMEYLAQLGAYIDDNLQEIEERFATVEAAIETVKQNHEAVVAALNGVAYDTSHALFAGLTATGGTVTSPALVEIKSTFDGVSGEIDSMQSQIQEDQASIAELGDELNTVSQWQTNASSTVTQTVPVAIDTETNGIKTKESQVTLFDSTGNYNEGFTQALWNAMAQLYLAAPNDDQTQVLGYLGDNSDDDHTADMSTLRPKSSAALTAAYEAGGSGGDVPENVVTYDSANHTLQSANSDIPQIDIGPLSVSATSLVLLNPVNEKQAFMYVPSANLMTFTNPDRDQVAVIELDASWPALTSDQLATALQTAPKSGRGFITTQPD